MYKLMIQDADYLTFLPATELSRAGQTACAQLIFASFPEFYSILPLPDDERTAVIVEQFYVARGEAGEATAAVSGGKVVGVYASLSSSRIKTAQLVSAAALIRALPKYSREPFQKALTVFSAQIPEVPQDTTYLSRLAVDVAYRGTGVAAKLMSHLYDTADGTSISVHALHSNARALAFYKKEGFKGLHNGDTEYVALLRPA